MYKSMREKGIPIVVILFSLLASVSAQESVTTLGDDLEWVRRSENVVFRAGDRGAPDIVIRDAEYSRDADTDLLLHFNSLPFRSQTPYYDVSTSGVEVSTDNARLGAGAAAFRGVGDQSGRGVFLAPQPGALFGPGTVWDSFSIEFWIYPATMADGESVLNWTGVDSAGDKRIQQQISAEIRDRRIRWRFTNVFETGTAERFSLSVTALSTLVPRRWSRHALRFDASIGLLEYLVDGRPEGIAYATSSGREAGTVYRVRIGESPGPHVTIGSEFVGFLDEVRITRRFADVSGIERTVGPHGSVISRPVDLGARSARFIGIDSVDDRPAATDILYYYRIGDTIADDDIVDAEWQVLRSGEALDPEPRGRFVQVRAELFADHRASPRLSKISVRYREPAPPVPPSHVTASASDGAVTLRWRPVLDESVSGYVVYYGDRPGRYVFATPIDVGRETEYTIDNLENGRLYFFAVAAYDEPRRAGRIPLSREISARPVRTPR